MSLIDSLSASNYPPIVSPGTARYSVQAKIPKARENVKTYGLERTDISEAYKIRFLSPNYATKEGDYKYDLVIGYLNEDFRESVASKWSNLLSLDNSVVDKFLAIAVNKTTKSLIMYRQIWEGNEPFSGKFILTFDAINNAFTDVYEPVRCLQKMASPGKDYLIGESIFTQVLVPPIPSAIDPSNGVTIGVGRMFD